MERWRRPGLARNEDGESGMTSEQWKEVDKLYQAAIDLQPSERTRFVADVRVDDEVRREVQSLLAHRGGDDGVLDRVALDLAADRVTGNQSAGLAGRTIGHYEVLSLIGKGGMGEVYRARDTRLDRTIALKLLVSTRSGDSQSHSRFLREARLAATLDHPNICTVFDVGESNGLAYIAMQYVEGRSLRSVIDGRPLPLETILTFAIQMAGALAAAHRREIIHRDIKPENVIINNAGDAKVLDFGLAKTIEDAAPNLTRSDVLVGTPAYMSPEQARGAHLDRRSDIFSFGVVLYEMATGEAPFRRESSVETMHAIIDQPHAPVRELNTEVPLELAKTIDRCLAKEPADRYSTMDELARDLQRLKTAQVQPQPVGGTRKLVAGAVAAALIVSLGGGWFAFNAYRETQARNQIPRIEELAHRGKYLEAYNLALNTRRVVPTDPKLTHLMRGIVNSVSITSEPPGARVFLRGFVEGVDPSTMIPQFAGVTPISDLEIAHGEYIVRLELAGYAPFEGSINGYNIGDVDAPTTVPFRPLKVTLIPANQSHPNMVYVPGTDYRLVSWRRPSDAVVKLDGFFIDKYEVSNQDYKEFVSSGGYLKKEYWKYPFLKGGREIPWADAIAEFVDRTRLPGPRDWSNQNYPDGKERHPVTGISWYEAAAYAAFRGKTLPTIFQWEKAARNGATTPVEVMLPWGISRHFAHHANLTSTGTVPTGSFDFGMSPFGVYEMAGNASEWLVNETTDGFLTAGASWADPAYSFGGIGPFPPFFSSDRLGFRCALNDPKATGDQGAFRIQLEDEVPIYTPAPEAQVSRWVDEFQYEKTPLEASVIERTETSEWIREKIAFAGGPGRRALAYLYLPKHFPKPFQVIHIVPAGDVFTLFVPLAQSMEHNWMSLVRSGRAVFAVVLQGMSERENPPGFVLPPYDSSEYTEFARNRITDMRRGLDYLETREDMAIDKLGFLFASAGNTQWLLPAIDPRFRS